MMKTDCQEVPLWLVALFRRLYEQWLTPGHSIVFSSLLAQGQVFIFFPWRHTCLSCLRPRFESRISLETAVSLLVSERGKGRAQEWALPQFQSLCLESIGPALLPLLAVSCPTIQKVWGKHLAGFTRYHHTVHLGSLGWLHRRMGECLITTWKAVHIRMHTLCSCDLERQTLWERVCFSGHSQNKDALMLSVVEPDLNSHPVASPYTVFILCACWRHWDTLSSALVKWHAR